MIKRKYALLNLSKRYAKSKWDEYDFISDLATSSGFGMRLTVKNGDENIILWIPETDWCRWIKPLITVPDIDSIEAELYDVLGCWTLTPFNEWLKSKGFDFFEKIDLEPRFSKENCWRITIASGVKKLRIYIEDAPEYWVYDILEKFESSSDYMQELKIILGWCDITKEEMDSIRIGDAIPIIGCGTSLDQFWISHKDIVQSIIINDSGDALTCNSRIPFDTIKNGLYNVEIGVTEICAKDISTLNETNEVCFESIINTYPLVHLTKNNESILLGSLIGFENGLALKIEVVNNEYCS